MGRLLLFNDSLGIAYRSIPVVYRDSLYIFRRALILGYKCRAARRTAFRLFIIGLGFGKVFAGTPIVALAHDYQCFHFNVPARGGVNFPRSIYKYIKLHHFRFSMAQLRGEKFYCENP